MNNKLQKLLFTFLIIVIFKPTAHAQEEKNIEVNIVGRATDAWIPPINRMYFSTGLEGNILSTAWVSNGMQQASLTTPRYTAWLNIGSNLNYNFTNHVGFFVGMSIKNIGFIEKLNTPTLTVKRRVIAAGIPIGLAIGNMEKGSYFFMGGGVDFPLHYKAKSYLNRNDKSKYSKWFSQMVAPVMPYIFVGARLSPIFGLKLQYYPTNFMNAKYKYPNSNFQPFEDYKVNIMTLSLSFNLSYFPHTDDVPEN